MVFYYQITGQYFMTLYFQTSIIPTKPLMTLFYLFTICNNKSYVDYQFIVVSIYRG